MNKIHLAVAAGAVVLGTVAGVAGTALLAPSAHASPAVTTAQWDAVREEAPGICAMLDADSSFTGILRVAATTMGVGHPAEEAGLIVGLSAMTQCPEYSPKLQKWAEAVTS